MSDASKPANPVRARLLKAALDCFLADEYHNVTTRMIAERADANVSMIRYYFGNKEGLYEEMIRDTLAPLIEAFRHQPSDSLASAADLFRLYYETMSKHPTFPKLILKVIALNHGPGRRFIFQLLERGRIAGVQKIDDLKACGLVDADFDPDVLRMSVVSLLVMPMVLKDVFEEQLQRPMDAMFLTKLAALNGRLLASMLADNTR